MFEKEDSKRFEKTTEAKRVVSGGNPPAFGLGGGVKGWGKPSKDLI